MRAAVSALFISVDYPGIGRSAVNLYSYAVCTTIALITCFGANRHFQVDFGAFCLNFPNKH